MNDKIHLGDREKTSIGIEGFADIAGDETPAGRRMLPAAADTTLPPPLAHGTDQVLALALGLAHAEKRLRTVTSGQVDAIVDLDGNPYLLRPAQDRLRQNGERLQTLLDSGSDLITVVGRGGLILSQTLAVRRILGYGPAELVGKNLFDFVHADDQPQLYSAFHNVIGGFLTDATAEFRHRARDGSYRMLEATVSKLRDVSVASVVLTCRDTTRRRQVQDEATRREAELAAALLSKDHLLATLSHELRTPLTPALLGVQALEEDERFAEAKPMLAMIRRNIEIEASLLEALLDFNQFIHGKQLPKLESVDAEVTLKIAEPAGPRAKALAPPPPDRFRILLVEDHVDTRAVLTRLLERHGHTVFAAQDTESALRLGESCDIELLISDIGLPDGTGYELMERLRSKQPSLAGIALSGFGTPSDRDRSRRAGFAEHLVKPVNLESLQSAIQGSHLKPKAPKVGNLSPAPFISKNKTTHAAPGMPADCERNSQ